MRPVSEAPQTAKERELQAAYDRLLRFTSFQGMKEALLLRKNQEKIQDV